MRAGAGFVDALLIGFRERGYQIKKAALIKLLDDAAEACVGCALIEQASQEGSADRPATLISLHRDGDRHVLKATGRFAERLSAADVAMLRARLLQYNEFQEG